MKKLPKSLDDLCGLRAARWLRESTPGQFDRFGPEAQREQQDRALERYALVDTGIAWSVAHSGRTVSQSTHFAQMVAAAGRDYDVLLVGYVSRFARDLRTAVNARHDLHSAGAALLFADERILSSDESAWEQWAREAVEAEAYSRRLSRRIQEGYAGKFRRHADPGGQPPLGFRRVPPALTLEIDPVAIRRVIALFERYATGLVSIREVAAEFGLTTGGVTETLKNPIYNGWVTRRGAEKAAATWRPMPPINDALWERVAELRSARSEAQGRRTPAGRVDLLRGLLVCLCGRRIRSNGTVRDRLRKSHPEPCGHWRGPQSRDARVWEVPIGSQIASIKHDASTIEKVIRALRRPEPTLLDTSRARIERSKRELALDHAASKISDEDYMAALSVLRAEASEPMAAVNDGVDTARAVAYLRDMPALWAKATDKERAAIVAATYSQITVSGDEFVSVRLTPAAYAHGLALALPERVRCSELARPTGFEPATFGSGGRRSIH